MFKFWDTGINATRNACNAEKNKLPIHIRCLTKHITEVISEEYAMVLEAAADHVNNIDGILDDYHLCFQ